MKIRKNFKQVKEGFLTGKTDDSYPAYMLANVTFILSIFLIFYITSAIVCNISERLGLCMVIISTILVLVFLLYEKAFSITIPISSTILVRIFGRYGKVVTKSDWKRIKKEKPNIYKLIWDKENFGCCYAIARTLALELDNAKLMYCSVVCKDGNKSGHVVVVKNNCVYDTNCRKHYDYYEYSTDENVEVYKIFEKEAYSKKSFFDDIRNDFQNWCTERNVYCDTE